MPLFGLGRDPGGEQLPPALHLLLEQRAHARHAPGLRRIGDLALQAIEQGEQARFGEAVGIEEGVAFDQPVAAHRRGGLREQAVRFVQVAEHLQRPADVVLRTGRLLFEPADRDHRHHQQQQGQQDRGQALAGDRAGQPRPQRAHGPGHAPTPWRVA